jgi:hypothetical protein
MRSLIWRLLTLLLTSIVVLTVAHANVVTVAQGSVYASDENLSLDADFDLKFSAQLQEALARGVSLYFLLEVEVSSPRWYWLDAKPINFQRTTKISYSPLLQQYRVNVNLLTTTYASFDDMQRAITRVRGVNIGDRGALKKGEGYQAFVRYRLDTNQLPKPLQFSSLTSSDWRLASEWTRVEIRP